MSEIDAEGQKEVALECRELHKRLGEGETQVHVLRGVNLKLYRGEVSAIVGPSGLWEEHSALPFRTTGFAGFRLYFDSRGGSSAKQ